MSPQQISLIQNSWRTLRNLEPAQIGDLFYSKLFLDRPELRRLFPTDMSGQHQKLIAMLHTLIARLDHSDRQATELADMGRRHAGYGVKSEHYRYVGAALLWTLERCLGDDWTAPVAEAWKTYYQSLSDTMLNGVRQ